MRSAKSDTISPARREAFRILFEIGRSGAHSDVRLRSKAVSALTAPDRGLCTTLVLGVLRWQIRLEALIRPLLAKPNSRLDLEVQTALWMGAYQLLFLDRIPAYAAIGESVAVCKAAGHTFSAGMVNAVLRKVAAMPKAAAWKPVESGDSRLIAEAEAHPTWLVERWVRFYGADKARAICRHGQKQPVQTVRLTGNEIEARLTEQGIRLSPGALLTSARSVADGDIAGSERFADAAFRIQDEGSQLIAELAAVAVDSPRCILDCCAAPGGKTLILAERHPEAEVTALEVHPGRCEALRVRMGEAAEAAPALFGRIAVREDDAVALAGDAASPNEPLEADPEWKQDSDEGGEPGWDLILADVPCSGTGTLGRNPEIRHRLQVGDLARHHERQCAILSSVLRSAEQRSLPGQMVRVVYSTCSLEPEENQDVIAEVLGQMAGWRQVSLAGPIARLVELGRLKDEGQTVLGWSLTAEGAMLLLPGMPIAGLETKLQTDGFFAALIERTL